MPGASDGDKAESDEEKRSRQTAAKSPPATAKSVTALTKAEKTSAAVVAAFVRYKKEWDNCADNAEGAKKELADAGRH